MAGLAHVYTRLKQAEPRSDASELPHVRERTRVNKERDQRAAANPDILGFGSGMQSLLNLIYMYSLSTRVPYVCVCM